MKPIHLAMIVAITAFLAGGGVYLIMDPSSHTASSDTQGADRKIIYWKAPMDPTEIYDEPGKSKMGMDLVPVYEDEVSGAPSGDSQVDGVDVVINPVVEQNMGLKIQTVEAGPLNHTIRTYGHLTFDETRTGRFSPRFDGWIERLHADYTGFVVKKGDPLFEIYSPALTASQEEFLSALKTHRRQKNTLNKSLYLSARKRLEYYGIDPREIRSLELNQRVPDHTLIRSPFTGVVVDKNAVEGGYVKAGSTLFTIVDLSVIWVEAHIFEYEQHLVYPGQSVEMELPYSPGTNHRGRIAYIFPYLQPKTRDVVIRLAFPNPQGFLKPDMYARIKIQAQKDREGRTITGLSIPSQAVIHSGENKIVFIARGKGRFSPREITTGLHLEGGRIQILTGLDAGERIVVSGQFLLDSESKLKEAIQKMMELKSKGKPAQEDFFGDMETEADFFNDADFMEEMNQGDGS